MIGRVPVARRALFQDRRRAALAAGGVAAALLLVLLLQGIFDGATRGVTTYLRSSPADVFVSERNVRTMHMSVSTLDPGLPARINRMPGVQWAEPIRFSAGTFLVAPSGAQQLSYVIGYDTTDGRGGPQHLVEGRPPREGEVLLERLAAQRLGVRVGDPVALFDDTFRVSGIFRGGTTITNTTSFITLADFAARRGPSIAYVLVGARPGVSGDELARRLAVALPGTTVQTRSRFVHEESALVKDMAADLMRIMTAVAFLIALAVIALTLFTLTLAKQREYAVVKALGGRTPRLLGVVLSQAAWSVGIAVVLATLLAVGLGSVVERVNPAIAVVVEPSSVLRVGAAALVAGAIGALIPLRRVVTVDPASAFRRA